MTEALSWYIARATGLVAWGLVSASIIWGFIVSTRLFGKSPSPAWFLDLHRYLGGLTVLFTAAHVAALVADNTVHFGAAEVLIPGHTSWRPWQVGAGVVGLYALVAIELTSLAMKRLPRRVWKAVHRFSFVLFIVVTVHALSAGTDTHNAVAWGIGMAQAVLVMFLALIHILSPRRRRAPSKDAPVHRGRRVTVPPQGGADVSVETPVGGHA